MKKPKAAAMGKPSTDQPEEEYKPTPREQEAIKAFVASREARKLSSRLTVKKAASGAFTIGFDHEDPFTGQILQQDSAERALNKPARTFTTQIEALKRYRSTGQQKVTVEHVTVQAGGQAIVGTVSHGTPANEQLGMGLVCPHR